MNLPSLQHKKVVFVGLQRVFHIFYTNLYTGYPHIFRRVPLVIHSFSHTIDWFWHVSTE
jgi:hypothetical protein